MGGPVGEPDILGRSRAALCQNDRWVCRGKSAMARRVGRTVVAAVTIGAALLVGNLLLSTLNTRQLRDESANVAHSSELLLALDNVLSLVKDAETGQRGYVITGKPEYLEPY